MAEIKLLMTNKINEFPDLIEYIEVYKVNYNGALLYQIIEKNEIKNKEDINSSIDDYIVLLGYGKTAPVAFRDAIEKKLGKSNTFTKATGEMNYSFCYPEEFDEYDKQILFEDIGFYQTRYFCNKNRQP